MKLSDLGENELLRSFMNLKNQKHVLIGPGDDAALIKPTSNIVLTVDSFSERTDFIKGTTFAQMGKKAVNGTLSDIAAMGAKPIAFLASLSLPKSLNKVGYDELVEGIIEACRVHNTSLVGGDLGENDDIIITGVGVGEKVHNILTRDNAKVGDVVCTTGYLGAAAAGLLSLKNEDNLKKSQKAQKIDLTHE